ncbi:MAG TPA: TonB-dependent receptor [Gammaproteobacteria bacterium]|nr:TonB-dependent receptor [Gammaproteobacteria bacterium]
MRIKKDLSRAEARRNLSLLAFSLPAAACAAALAGHRAEAQEQSGRPGVQLEEVVVTARFREESLQQTPLAITALTSEKLEVNGATSVIDVGDWAPNVVINQLGAGWGPTLSAAIRGLGYGDFKATSEPTVTIYVDDVVLGRPTGAILDLLDLERVEVLRGPQGTLFGKNAIGGVVRLISRKPGEGQQGGNVEVTLGDYNRVDVRGSFETTLVPDKLFSRISFVSKKRDGWQKNLDFRCQMIQDGTPQLAGVDDGIVGWTRDPDGPTGTDPNNTIPGVGGPGAPIFGAVGSAADNAFALPTRTSALGTHKGCLVDTMGDQDLQAARGMLRWAASDKFEMLVALDITDQNDHGPFDLLTAANPNTTLGRLYNNAVALPTWGVPWDERFIPKSRDVNYSGFDSTLDGIETPNINDVRHWGLSTTYDMTFDQVAVKLILAHREFDAQWGRDSDVSPMPINHTLDTFNDNQNTAEVRVSGQLFSDKTQWTVGAFYFDADDLNSNISVLYPCLLGTSCIDRVDTQNTHNTGVFINTVTALTDKLSLTVGLRNSRDRKEILQERFDRAGNDCCGFDPPTLVVAESSNTDPMISLSYDVNDNVMVYTTFQSGFRGGGTTARPTATTRVPFGPEYLDNLEVGIKSDLLNSRLRLNATVFDMDYTDMQIGSAGLDQFGQAAWVTSNAGSATIRGFELEMQSTWGQHWLVDASVGHTDFEYTDVPSLQDCLANGFPASSCSGLIDMNSVPGLTPAYTAALNFGYVTSLGNGSQLSFRYGMSYEDETFFGANNDPLTRAPAYTLHNARIAWTSSDNSWEAALFGTNITDERAIESKLNFLNLFGTVETTYVRPAEWAVSVKKRF